MKPSRVADATEGPREPGTFALLPSGSSVEAADSTALGPAHMHIFEVIAAQDQPLTVRQIAWLTKLPAEDLRTVVENLCELRLLRRLNTVIESYIAVL